MTVETSTLETSDSSQFESVNNTRDVSQPIVSDAVYYAGHYYKLFNISLPWTEAEDYCIGIGGHLVLTAKMNKHL